jgi:hypothetical protein
MKKIPTLVLLVVVASFVLTGLTLHKYIIYRKWHAKISAPGEPTYAVRGLVAHWNFDDIRNGTTPDSSGNNLDGKFERYFDLFLFPQPSLVDGVKDKALSFKGRQWVSAGNKRCFAVEQFTVTVWVWRDKEEFEKGDFQLPKVPTIIAKSSWPAVNGWWLCSGLNSKYIDMGIAYGEDRTHVKSGYMLPFEEWHFIGVTMDNINNEIQFYVDGKPYGEKHRRVKKWLTNWDHDLYIGEYDGTGNYPWQGKLDDVRFYNVLLSENEIAGLYYKSAAFLAPSPPRADGEHP